MIKILSYDPKKGKMVEAGKFNPETKTFFKKVNRNHYFRIRQGYGISEDVYAQIDHMDCKEVSIENETETRQISFSFVKDLKNENFGSGYQRFIPWNKMSAYISKQTELFNDYSKV